jgi:uncharacterized protein (TIGR03067 family)
MNRVLLTIVAVCLGLTSARGDVLKDLNGTWTISEAQLGGEKAPDDLLKITLTITDGKYSVKVGERTETGAFTIDAKQKPMTLDVSAENGPNKDKKMLAIFELSDDTLKVCYKLDYSGRPKEFASTKDDNQFLVTYKRKN